MGAPRPRSTDGMIPEVERGTRSVHDAQAWNCVCGAVNEPKECLIFDIPKFKCQCSRKFNGDFDFCLGDVRVNGNLLVENVLEQKDDQCTPTSICQALKMMHVLDSVRKKQDIDQSKMDLNPQKLVDRYHALFPSIDLVPGCFAGVHKFVNMSLILRDEGIALNDGGFYKIGDLCSIPGDDFEAICEELAQGNPLLTVFNPGLKFFDLKYCQVYAAPFLTEVIKAVEDGEVVESHMIVLIGAFSKNGLRGFYFLNSHGDWFCPRNITENPQAVPIRPAVCYGIGKIFEKSIFWNAMKFLPEGEAAGDGVERVGPEDDPNTVSEANILLCCNRLDEKLVDFETVNFETNLVAGPQETLQEQLQEPQQQQHLPPQQQPAQQEQERRQQLAEAQRRLAEEQRRRLEQQEEEQRWELYLN